MEEFNVKLNKAFLFAVFALSLKAQDLQLLWNTAFAGYTDDIVVPIKLLMERGGVQFDVSVLFCDGSYLASLLELPLSFC